jgi:hypothetical protein
MDPNQAPQTPQQPEPVTPAQPTQPAPMQSVPEPQAQPAAAFTPDAMSQPAPVTQPNVAPQQMFAADSASTAAAPKSKLPLIIAAVVVVLLLIGGGIAIAAGGKKDTPVVKATTPKAATKATTPTVAAKTDAQTIPLDNKVIVDDEMGYTIRATSLTIGKFSIPERYKANNSDKTVVTVHFKNSDTNKFSGSAKNLVLSLITSDSEKITETSLNDADITAAGLNRLTNAKEVNDTVEGEEVYWVPTAQLSKLTLRYKRLAAGVIGSDKTIPAKEFDIVLR